MPRPVHGVRSLRQAPLDPAAISSPSASQIGRPAALVASRGEPSTPFAVTARTPSVSSRSCQFGSSLVKPSGSGSEVSCARHRAGRFDRRRGTPRRRPSDPAVHRWHDRIAEGSGGPGPGRWHRSTGTCITDSMCAARTSSTSGVRPELHEPSARFCEGERNAEDSRRKALAVKARVGRRRAKGMHLRRIHRWPLRERLAGVGPSGGRARHRGRQPRHVELDLTYPVTGRNRVPASLSLGARSLQLLASARASPSPGSRGRRGRVLVRLGALNRNGHGTRAIVVGGGIGGLGAAIALRGRGHEVVVLERAPQLDVVGAGITLFANAMNALDLLGVADAVSAAGSPARHSAILTSTGRQLTALPADLLEGAVAVDRGDLQAILFQAADSSPARAEGSSREIDRQLAEHHDFLVLACARDPDAAELDASVLGFRSTHRRRQRRGRGRADRLRSKAWSSLTRARCKS
jgi:hypothetical protein